MCDVAYNCLPYHFAAELPALRGFAGMDLKGTGIPVGGLCSVCWCCLLLLL
jgi:hypothetical protein